LRRLEGSEIGKGTYHPADFAQGREDVKYNTTSGACGLQAAELQFTTKIGSKTLKHNQKKTFSHA
jgi:hypothetical protein